MSERKQACRDCSYCYMGVNGLRCSLLNMVVEYCATEPCKAGS